MPLVVLVDTVDMRRIQRRGASMRGRISNRIPHGLLYEGYGDRRHNVSFLLQRLEDSEGVLLTIPIFVVSPNLFRDGAHLRTECLRITTQRVSKYWRGYRCASRQPYLRTSVAPPIVLGLCIMSTATAPDAVCRFGFNSSRVFCTLETQDSLTTMSTSQ